MQKTPALSAADVLNLQQDLAKIKSEAESFSKVADDNGEPLLIYHGTNRDIFSEDPGQAVFDDRYRGAGSGACRKQHRKKILT